MSKQPFFVTHYSDWAAKQDAHNNLVDVVNASNLMVARVGGICEQHDYRPDKPETLRCYNCGMQTIAELPQPKGKG